MTDDSLLILIANSADRLWLLRCRDQNVKTGKSDIAQAAISRLADLDLIDALKIKQGNDTIDGRVVESLRVYRAILKHKHGKNQAAGYTEREIKQYGPKEALIRTIRRGKKTDGLITLLSNGRLDCSYEQIAIDFEHEMPEDVVKKARATLADLVNE